MATKDRISPRNHSEIDTIPFASAEEAWFWFVQGMQARNEGARFTQGQGLYPRPCEPIDIMKVVDRLYRKRRLVMDHLLVLRHYGKRMVPPDRFRAKEMRAHKIWHEALGRIEAVLVSKNIVHLPATFFLENTK
jgi:hypothetical protein